jgi:predicted amidophosphoribosyltransferase
MICRNCGETLQDNAEFCSKCGEPVSIEAKNTVHTSPTDISSQEENAIWNPNAASNWSLVFTPAFGSYLHARNW